MSLSINKLRRKISLAVPDMSDEDLETIMGVIEPFMEKKQAQVDKLARKVDNDFSLTARRVRGALKNCIDAHGPITPEFIGSAAKRVHCAMLCQ